MYGEACRKILSDVYESRLETYGSVLVAVEILGSLAEVEPKVAVGAVHAFLSFPIRMIPIDERVIETAADIALETQVSYDSVHAAAMARARVPTIVTEDLEHWRKISKSWARVREKTGIELEGIEVVRPAEYAKWKNKQ